MSQVCRFYLKGTCKYGDSCHFIHDNNYYSKNNENYSDQSYGYRRNNYNENYSYRNRDTYNSSYDSPQNFNKNYNRYHVDHRQQSQPHPIEIKPENVTLSQFLEIIKTEIKQFEERHVWKLSVISPIKKFGNIPGFQDYSPEEIRYQFYTASSNNTFHEFKKTMEELRENLIQTCQLMSNNASAYNIVKQMMSGNSTTEGTTSTFQNAAPPSSSFTFDLNALPKQNAEFLQQQSFSQSNSNAFSSFSFAQPPSSNAPAGSQINWINRQSFPNQPSQINSFSFNNQNVVAAQTPSAFPSAPQNLVLENNPCYSKMEELSPEQIQAFQAPTFKYGYIPLQPPPKELCSKLSY